MSNKGRAVFEILGLELSNEQARRFFSRIYRFILYNDTPCLFEVLDYRTSARLKHAPSEDYHIFKFMLRKMKSTYPAMLSTLNPAVE